MIQTATIKVVVPGGVGQQLASLTKSFRTFRNAKPLPVTPSLGVRAAIAVGEAVKSAAERAEGTGKALATGATAAAINSCAAPLALVTTGIGISISVVTKFAKRLADITIDIAKALGTKGGAVGAVIGTVGGFVLAGALINLVLKPLTRLAMLPPKLRLSWKLAHDAAAETFRVHAATKRYRPAMTAAQFNDAESEMRVRMS